MSVQAGVMVAVAGRARQESSGAARRCDVRWLAVVVSPHETEEGQWGRVQAGMTAGGGSHSVAMQNWDDRSSIAQSRAGGSGTQRAGMAVQCSRAAAREGQGGNHEVMCARPAAGDPRPQRPATRAPDVRPRAQHRATKSGDHAQPVS
jgi:hypothetical protein